MQLGAVLCVEEKRSQRNWPHPATVPVAGQSGLERMRARLEGEGAAVLISRGDIQRTVALSQQFEQVLWIRANTYFEFSLRGLLNFHFGRKLTRLSNGELYDAWLMPGSRVADFAGELANGQLDAAPVWSGVERGYPLASMRDLRNFGSAILAGKLQTKPVGTQIAPGVWVGDGAMIDAHQYSGPVYVGARTRVCEGAYVAPGSLLEQGCEIDFGTVVESATVLPHTYVGAGLFIRNSIASAKGILHLEHESEIALSDPRLLADRRGRRAAWIEGICEWIARNRKEEKTHGKLWNRGEAAAYVSGSPAGSATLAGTPALAETGSAPNRL